MSYELLFDHAQLLLKFYPFAETIDLVHSLEGRNSLPISYANLVMHMYLTGMSMIFTVVRVIFLPF